MVVNSIGFSLILSGLLVMFVTVDMLTFILNIVPEFVHS